MIKNFKCKETRKIFEGIYSKKFALDIQSRALMKLRMIDSSRSLQDLRTPPSNHLEMLKGDRLGEVSIRINKQWRICFKWQENEAYAVEICDYH